MVRTGGFVIRAFRWRLRGRLAGGVWCLCLLAFVVPAHALEGGRDAAAPSPDMPLVGSLSVNGQLFSAVLIGPKHVLTAAHVVAGAAPDKLVFRTPLAGGVVLSAEWVWVNPGYSGKTADNLPGDPSVHADIAVVKLVDAVSTALRPAPLWGGPLLGQVVTLVSHGGSTSLVTLGENRVDVVFPGRLGQAATYLFDFDGPDPSSNALGPATAANRTLGKGREASLVKGDSGSAAFVFAAGEWQLAGINTFQVKIGSNRGAGGVVLSSYRHWIEEALAAKAPPTAPAAAVVQPAQPAPVPFKP
jgi:hypothetical protein